MTNTAEITIRPADATDERALNELAIIDSADSAPAAPVLLAEVDGRLRAALSMKDGKAVADPFYPSAGLVRLLRFSLSLSGR